jgi:hypothetical protein
MDFRMERWTEQQKDECWEQRWVLRRAESSGSLRERSKVQKWAPRAESSGRLREWLKVKKWAQLSPLQWVPQLRQLVAQTIHIHRTVPLQARNYWEDILVHHSKQVQFRCMFEYLLLSTQTIHRQRFVDRTLHNSLDNREACTFHLDVHQSDQDSNPSFPSSRSLSLIARSHRSMC